MIDNNEKRIILFNANSLKFANIPIFACLDQNLKFSLNESAKLFTIVIV